MTAHIFAQQLRAECGVSAQERDFEQWLDKVENLSGNPAAVFSQLLSDAALHRGLRRCVRAGAAGKGGVMGRAVDPSKVQRNLKILKLRGTMSFSLIGKALGVTRDVVAGVLWRADNPIEVRKARCPGDDRKTGTGHHGPGRYPRRTKFTATKTPGVTR